MRKNLRKDISLQDFGKNWPNLSYSALEDEIEIADEAPRTLLLPLEGARVGSEVDLDTEPPPKAD